MKTSTKLFLVLALVCFTAQASFVDSLLNNTRLRGKTVFNTTNGVSVGYEGGVSVNFAGKDIDLVSLGMNFNAKPEVQGSNTGVNTSVKYSGGISFSDVTNTTSTNVTITGIAKVLNTVNVTYDNKTKITTVNSNNSFTDTNSFVIRTGVNVISGRGSESLSTSGTVVQKGDCVKVNQNTNITLGARGVVTSNGSSLGAYTAQSTTTSNTNNKVELHHWSWLPDATFTGNSQFDNQNSLNFQNTVYNLNKSGSVDVIGYNNVKTDGGATNVRSGQGIHYSYDTASSVNGTVSGTSSGYGVGKVFTSVGTNASGNSSSNGLFTKGHIHQAAHITDGPSQVEGSKTNVRDKLMKIAHEMGKHSHLPALKHRKSCSKSYYSTSTTRWEGGYLTNNEATSNTTGVTNTTVGVEYRSAGIDTKNRLPWSIQGKQSGTASFKTTNLGNNISVVENVTLKASSEPEFQSKMARLQASAGDDEKYLKSPLLINQ